MDRDDELPGNPGDWDDVRDEERGREGGHTSGGNVQAEPAGRVREGRRSLPPRGYRRPDDRIRDDIYDRLCGQTGADASDVVVSVRAGEVTVTGTVPDSEDERRILRVVERAVGVRGVVNQLRVLAPA
jgi:osmotically-inducible protein OsmY